MEVLLTGCQVSVRLSLFRPCQCLGQRRAGSATDSARPSQSVTLISLNGTFGKEGYADRGQMGIGHGRLEMR